MASPTAPQVWSVSPTIEHIVAKELEITRTTAQTRRAPPKTGHSHPPEATARHPIENTSPQRHAPPTCSRAEVYKGPHGARHNRRKMRRMNSRSVRRLASLSDVCSHQGLRPSKPLRLFERRRPNVSCRVPFGLGLAAGAPSPALDTDVGELHDMLHVLRLVAHAVLNWCAAPRLRSI